MEIVVTARHTTISDRFRQHLHEKLEKVETFGKRVDRIEVCVAHESNPRQASQSERIEITVRQYRSVVRAEASADDLYAALDLVQDKLVERLRRARDRGKGHHSRRLSVVTDTGSIPVTPPASSQTEPADEAEDDYSPVVIRRKEHQARPMTLDDALSEMELVGHDFYLYEDSETGKPSVVYRRKGWNYGVIALESMSESALEAVPDEDQDSARRAIGGM